MHSAGTPRLIYQYVATVFPMVKQELERWSQTAAAIPDPVLREQALASIRHKAFHTLGGSVYALYPGVEAAGTVKFVVALQTISDYLDNLCDRAGVTDETAFRRLHLAMADAVAPERAMTDYYAAYPNRADSIYLNGLVQECRRQIACLPAYPLVQETMLKYCGLYSELQSLKHLNKSVRQNKLETWAELQRRTHPELSWPEFAAATGSTLGMFLLFTAAANPRLSGAEVRRFDEAYFPWIHALHILLDYLIDSEEDRQMGDLNFVHYYQNPAVCRERLGFLIQKSLHLASRLPEARFHRFVIHGLLAMYLSDPKAFLPQHRSVSRQLLRCGGFTSSFYRMSCCALRSLKLLG